MNYDQTLKFLLGQTDYERITDWTMADLDLARMEALLALVGNPHMACRSVQIAGTKGKGSTAAIVASILECAGFSVGLFTSPHLLDLRERIRLNERLIPRKELVAIAEILRPAVSALSHKEIWSPPTTFEILTAAAFLFFARQRAQFQVLETGLGGRLDSTNVVTNPVVEIITSISLDHMTQLGGTVRQIAAEKAGIIKPGAIVVTVPQATEAMCSSPPRPQASWSWSSPTSESTDSRTCRRLSGSSRSETPRFPLSSRCTGRTCRCRRPPSSAGSGISPRLSSSSPARTSACST